MAEALRALDTLARPFDRDTPVHVTGSGVLTGRRGVLLLKHRKLGIWVQPGGHLEPGETPWEAAARETSEETGIEVLHAAGDVAGGPAGAPRLAHVDVHPAGDGHTHLDLRYMLEPSGDDTPRPPAGESQEVGWWGWEEACELADPGLAGILTQLRPPPL